LLTRAEKIRKSYQ